MVGVTSQGSGAGEWSDKARDQSRVSNESDRNREQEQDTGPRKNTTPRQSLQVWPSLKYTSIISSRCFDWLQG
ncbi:unnamed protein product [Staurois parvus]|uniref:Uncharacterized protein n=1 Tax=Staurois parvus TaxID=386267 RepID=A0ABN9APA1_9NEOB|nr:unnamed protein product [Staurois parvus]